MDFASVKLLLVSHHELYLVSVKLSKLENILQQCAPQQENHSLHNFDPCYHMITFLNMCQETNGESNGLKKAISTEFWDQ